MADLDNTQTLMHLREAYIREARANMRYHFTARLADAAARPDVAHVLRAAADEEKGHALGFLDLLVEHGAHSPEIVSETLAENLKASVEAELHEFSVLYTRCAEVAAAFRAIARVLIETGAEAGREGQINTLRETS